MARVEHWLAGPVPESVEVEVELTPPGASLSIRRGGGAPALRRFPRLDGACADRVEALALALAIALDPVAVSRRVEAEQAAEPVEPDESPRAPEPSTRQVDERDSESPRPSVRDEPRAHEISFGLALGGGLAWNWLEAPAIAGALALDVGIHPNLTLRAAFLVTGERDSSLGTARYGGRIIAGEVAVRAGRALGAFRLEGSVGLLVGAMIARGKGFPENLRSRRPWVAFAAGPRLAVALTERVGAALFVDAVVSALRARVHVMDPNGSSLGTSTTPSAGLRLGVEAFALF